MQNFLSKSKARCGCTEQQSVTWRPTCVQITCFLLCGHDSCGCLVSSSVTVSRDLGTWRPEASGFRVYRVHHWNPEDSGLSFHWYLQVSGYWFERETGCLWIPDVSGYWRSLDTGGLWIPEVSGYLYTGAGEEI